MSDTISLNKEEFKSLLKLAYLGNWVATAHREEDPENCEYDLIFNKLLKLAPQFDLADWVDDGEDGIFPASAMEEDSGILSALENYDAHTFWSELVERMTDRELSQELGSEAWEKMSAEEQLEHCLEIDEALYQEFATNGLDNLTLDRTNLAPE